MADPQDVVHALANLRGISEQSLLDLLRDVRRGDVKAVEWAISRIEELEYASNQIAELFSAAVSSGALVPLSEAARVLGVEVSGLYKRLDRSGILTVGAPPSPWKGPPVTRYVHRDDLDQLALVRRELDLEDGF
ncbi:MAG: hypothetical protein GEU28_10905 [Dehalococcoidia bacterium]|nr:hypothetical protein [Dehalococcoidia bacterium]